ncbi:response regulator [Flavisolibacter tropicus]|uniref:Response regulatory domain-containing protein n=1 Tax=Flavisolibacter tropicus TaxID=1492898 RepID=A0A172TVQ8_9BACT|nr:response regulator [Flavisolibacter tropicus]ANE50827.1 hypothetical protein SY85_10230 [Flavisolibacter tropicus]
MPVHHCSILYVDDDTDDQLLVLETLAILAPNATVMVAGNGVETLAYLNGLENEDLPALIIMDINMPLLNGKETVIEIRSEPRFNSIPIVLFTTSTSRLDEQFSALYNIPFITKPATSRELERVMGQMLQLQSSSLHQQSSQ